MSARGRQARGQKQVERRLAGGVGHVLILATPELVDSLLQDGAVRTPHSVGKRFHRQLQASHALLNRRRFSLSVVRFSPATVERPVGLGDQRSSTAGGAACWPDGTAA